MSYKKASIIVLSILSALGAAGCWVSLNIKDSTQGAFASQSSGNFFGGPRFYPLMICGLTVVFCIWALILVACQKDDRKIEIPNVKNMLFVLAATVIWALLWQFVGQFYIISFVAMTTILYFLNPEKHSTKKIIKSLLISAVVVAFVYLIFDVALKISL